MTSLGAIGVTPVQKKKFESKGITCVEDLLNYAPRKYRDFTQVTGVRSPDETSCVVAVMEKLEVSNSSKIPFLRAICKLEPGGERLCVTWFRQTFLKQKYGNFIGHKVFIAGKITYNDNYGQYEILMPETFDFNVTGAMKILPQYSKIQGMSGDYLAESIAKAVTVSSAHADPLPYDVVKSSGYETMRDTYHMLHCPKTMAQVERARKRLMFNDLMYFALANDWASRNSPTGSPYQVKTIGLMNKVMKAVPYQLTEDQKNTVIEIIAYANSGRRANALVQGDVGCGKTIVSFMLMAAFAGSGYQTVLMAPTKVLAKQHYENLKELVEPLGYKVVFLGTGMKAAERKAALKDIADGSALFVVGTHSVIAKDVVYKNLALTVADEEHKFGVAQRAALLEKAQSGAHAITMSATPIPRSLAEVIYGNAVQLYTIKTRPAGRLPIKTVISTGRENLYKRLYVEVKRGHQVYVVCPMIEQNDEMADVDSVEEVERAYRDALEGYGIRIATLTGKDSKTYTEETIAKFKAHDFDILISTTVIEVGVDVPNATVMVITNAERFGLSSMHQLRGRVGRSSLQAYCVLEPHNITPEANKRLEAMCSTNNGFEIAEADLKIRGAGDILGTRQSGDNKYMELMLAFPDEYKKCQEIAKKMLDEDVKCRMISAVKKEPEEDEETDVVEDETVNEEE